MGIPNNLSQPDGCDIISREDKLKPEICNDDDASFRNWWRDLTYWYHRKLPGWYM